MTRAVRDHMTACLMVWSSWHLVESTSFLHVNITSIIPNWLNGLGLFGLVYTTKAGRLGSNPDWVIPKIWKMILAACLSSCSALMAGCKRTFHMQFCHWLNTSAAFTVKTAMLPRVQARGNGWHQPLMIMTLRNQVEFKWNWTELKFPAS